MLSKMAEMVGFEPTCRANGKLISSQPRYDHFDTSPQHMYYNLYSSKLQEIFVKMELILIKLANV